MLWHGGIAGEVFCGCFLKERKPGLCAEIGGTLPAALV